MIERLQRLATDLERRAIALQASLEQRVVVEQAKGVLAERLGLPVAECGGILERGALKRELPTHRFAAEILSGATELGGGSDT